MAATQSLPVGLSLFSDYQLVERSGHSTLKVGDYLYMWGGIQPDLPTAHNNEKKKAMSSVIEAYHLPTGAWEQKATIGVPPLGISGYASAVIGNEIFYYGGYCNHDDCYHNSLYSFNVDTLTWKLLSSTTPHHGPRMKHHCGMVPIHFDGESYLVLIGGYGPAYNNTLKQPGAQYRQKNLVTAGMQHTNEIYYYKLSTDQWLTPTITGNRPPPIEDFTLTMIDSNTAILFGGDTPNGESNNLFIIRFSKMSMNISELPIGQSELWPSARWGHSSVLIHDESSEPYLLVVGGYPSKDCWLFNINKREWQELTCTVPVTVTGRYYHSLAAWSVTPINVWVIEHGGFKKGPIVNTTAIIELTCTQTKEWSISFITLSNYQEKLKKRRREWEELKTARQNRTARRSQLNYEHKEILDSWKIKEHVQLKLHQELKETRSQLQEKEKELQAVQEELSTISQSQEKLFQKRERDIRLEFAETELQLQVVKVQLSEAKQQANVVQFQLQEKEKELSTAQLQLSEAMEELNGLRRELEEKENLEREKEKQLKEEDGFWFVRKDDIVMTERVLGRGGWGEVRVALFQGLKVAAKVLHETIISEYNLSIFSREMEIAAKVRHPNLLQFIGATKEGNPIILTELMPTSLRKELEGEGLPYPTVLSISLDVACALNYLHLFKPPILHRDVSSANVLLQSMGGGYGSGWRAKLSDYGSANLQPLIGTTSNPGNPVYSAPEAANPTDHSPAMDAYSYGVLLLEMVTRRIPLPHERIGLIDNVRKVPFKSLIQRCLVTDPAKRLKMSEIITELNDMLY